MIDGLDAQRDVADRSICLLASPRDSYDDTAPKPRSPPPFSQPHTHTTHTPTTAQAYNQYKAKKAAEAAAGGGAASSGGGGGGMSALFAKRFYEGGFEDKMTRREAALILGVRYVWRLRCGCVAHDVDVDASSSPLPLTRVSSTRAIPISTQRERVGAADQGGAPSDPHAEPPGHGRLHLHRLQDQRGACGDYVESDWKEGDV